MGLGSERGGDTPDGHTVATIVVVGTGVEIATIEVEVVCIGSIRVGRTRPIVSVGPAIVERGIVDVAGSNNQNMH